MTRLSPPSHGTTVFIVILVILAVAVILTDVAWMACRIRRDEQRRRDDQDSAQSSDAASPQAPHPSQNRSSR